MTAGGGAFGEGGFAPPLPAGLPESPARRRLLALGLLGAILAFLCLGILAPLLDGMAERAEHEARQLNLLARLERLSAQGPALRRDLEALDAELAAPDMLLRARSASQAAAQLQSSLRRILEAEGLDIETAQALPPAPQGPLLRLGLRVELRAGIEPLSRVLKAIEAHRPNLAVREALIAAPREASGAAPGGRPAEPLAVRLDVFGLAMVSDDAPES